MTQHWSEDDFWVGALSRYAAAREAGMNQVTIDVDRLEDVVYDGDGPAYRLLEAMLSVQEHEGWDGCRGAPRVLLALLQVLGEMSRNHSSSN